MKRYCILDGDECAIVEEKLDEAGIDYDWGPLDRLIVENDEDCDEVEDILALRQPQLIPHKMSNTPKKEEN